MKVIDVSRCGDCPYKRHSIDIEEPITEILATNTVGIIDTFCMNISTLKTGTTTITGNRPIWDLQVIPDWCPLDEKKEEEG